MESFFTKLVDKTVGSVYLRDYNRNIADLRNQLQLLKESREAVKSVVTPEVEQWLARVDKVIREYDELLRPEEFEVNRFIDLKSRYKVSKKAEEGILLADRLQRECKFNQVYDPAPPPAPTYDFTLRRDLGVFESRRPTYEAIIKALQGDEISIIGVYGMAGVGKTTLVREIAKYAEFNHLFDEILMAVVSPTPNIRKIQGEIADALGLQFDVESDYGRAGRLYARIKNVTRILVILDGLRTALDLEAIGIPHGDAHEGCKIVLTSRELDVCHQMNAQTSNCIQVLSESEAWTLFEKTASNIEDVPDVLPVAQKVAKECGGLPVAIVSVAKALRGKNDIVWKDALSKLKKSEGLHDHIFRSLKLSYELLETEELKTCFLLCCLFPEDYDIPIKYLVRYGIGLRWYRNVDSLIEAIFSAHTMIDELKACGLLLDGIDKGSTRMHDVVRDFAISVASGGEHAFLVKAGSGGVTGWPKVEAVNQYKVISLIGNFIKKFPPYGLVCPNLEMLLLQCDSDSVEMPNQFFEGMEKLRVLHLRRMSIPLSIGYLKKLRTLCLECCKIPHDLREIKELQDLEILSIVDSDIEELPSAIGWLSKLRLLDLAYCKKLKVISPGILARLTQLEGLYMRNSFKDWAGHGQDYNASLAELKALSSLKVLEMHIPDAELYPKDLLLDKLTEFKITIGGEFDQHDIYSYSRNLELENLSDTLEGGGVNMLLTRAELVVLKDSMVEQNALFDLTHHDFRNLRVVTVFDCHKLKSLFRHIMGRGLGQLRELDVRSCSNMEAILEEDGGAVLQQDEIVFSDLKSMKLIGLPNLKSFLDARLHEPLFHRKVLFPSLEELYLWGLDNMEEIWYKQLLPAQSFYSLRDLSIGSCEKLITVIPSNLSGRLNILAKFSVWDCDLVQEICEGWDATSLILPHISVLRLWGLPKLEHIWWNKVSHNFISLQNIKILRIYRCKSLRYVFSVSVSKDLGQLETLAVGKCDMMKAIIADEGQEEIEAVNRIVFPKLHTLELKYMEQLTSFYQGDCNLEFGSLEVLRIEKCPLIKTFTENPKEASATAQPFGGEQSPITAKLHNIKLGGLTELQKRDIHSIAQHSTKEKTVEMLGGKVRNKSIGNKNGETKKIKGTVKLMQKNVSDSNDWGASILVWFDELVGKGVSIQLISAVHGDPANGLRGKLGKAASLGKWISTPLVVSAGDATLNILFEWDESMGIPGAFIIKNHRHRQFYLKTVTLEDVPGHGQIHFICNSWVYPTDRYNYDRVFFANKTYLPCATPEPLRKYREEELNNLRGNGSGMLKEWDRVYDYAYYNDLGSPDKGPEYARPVIGGSKEFPYPRRGRTGRPPTKKDPNTESGLPLLNYVPRDERFSHMKFSDFLALKSLGQILIPAITSFDQTPNEFDSFQDVLKLYEGGVKLPDGQSLSKLRECISWEMPKELHNDGEQLFKLPMPDVIKEDKSAWRTDEEFGREMLAGINPVVIGRLQEFPPASKLDPAVYGNQISAIKREHIEKNMNGLTVDEALENKKLFILDHHDALMPYLGRINTTTTKTYATRTLLLLQNDGTLKPLAIELSLPHPQGDKYGATSKVFTPAEHGVDGSVWQLAKAYAAINDSGYHQLISHWLNTHAVIEPFVIATNRQLSVLHPIHKLLHPHFRDTMNINALARHFLINAGGVLEMTVFPAKFAMEMSAVIYKSWVFTDQALPADLLKRGMAVPDSSSPHGLRLLIEDYPYAVDGLEIWSAIETWVREYCSFYYHTDVMIQGDSELQSWWTELRNVGHGDKKDEPWWPMMETRDELIQTCTIIIWVASALHAAVNFGQYPYAGYLPNRPTISRRFMPEPGTPEYAELESNPEGAFLKTITSQPQTLLGVFLVEVLSRHSSEEVYLGQRDNAEWTSDAQPREAFERFGRNLLEIENRIMDRNNDKRLKNRVGPVKVPYTLLYPNITGNSKVGGLTGKGIPNSVSI